MVRRVAAVASEEISPDFLDPEKRRVLVHDVVRRTSTTYYPVT